MLVIRKTTSDPTVDGLLETRAGRLRFLVADGLNRVLRKLCVSRAVISRSLAWFSTGIIRSAEGAGVDLIQLHYVGNSALGLGELARAKVPLAWRIADMWPLCGGEHYPLPGQDPPRWRLGYDQTPRSHDLRFDIDRMVWERKRRSIPKRTGLVATSEHVRWCLEESPLYRDFRKVVIPNPLDTGVFRSHDREAARAILGLDRSRRVILYGALQAYSDERKGWRLLREALDGLPDRWQREAQCVVFGEDAPAGFVPPRMPCQSLGLIQDDRFLSLVYSAADVLVVPSLQETFGQTVTEAMACGIPVIAFRGGGPGTLIEHQRTGWLAPRGNVAQLAAGIGEFLEHADFRVNCGRTARTHAETTFSFAAVASLYRQFYQGILSGPSSPKGVA